MQVYAQSPTRATNLYGYVVLRNSATSIKYVSCVTGSWDGEATKGASRDGHEGPSQGAPNVEGEGLPQGGELTVLDLGTGEALPLCELEVTAQLNDIYHFNALEALDHEK